MAITSDKNNYSHFIITLFMLFYKQQMPRIYLVLVGLWSIFSLIEAFQVLLLYSLLVWLIIDIVILLVLLQYNTVYRMYPRKNSLQNLSGSYMV